MTEKGNGICFITIFTPESFDNPDKNPGVIHLGNETTVSIVHHLSLITNSEGLKSNPLGANSFLY